MKYHKAKIKITADLTIHKVSGFEGFNRESVGTQYVSASLDGWALAAGETLHIAFKHTRSNYTVAPIILGYDPDENVYYTEVPIDVMALAGEWQMQAHKKYNWDASTGKADKTLAGSVDVFNIRCGIEDVNGNAVTEYDVSNVYNTAVTAADKAKERAEFVDTYAAQAQADAARAEISANDALESMTAARLSEIAAKASETAAKASETAAGGSAGQAAASEQSARISATTATEQRQLAETARTDADAARDYARKFAVEPTPFTYNGKEYYSSKHFAELSRSYFERRNKAFVFQTTEQAKAWYDGSYAHPQGLTKADLVPGDLILIVELGVPDVWYSGNTETDASQWWCGYPFSLWEGDKVALLEYTERAENAADEASASMRAAAISETNAKNGEINAAASASTAVNAKIAAETYAAAAAGSSTSAASARDAAAASASEAERQAVSATNAQTSASASAATATQKAAEAAASQAASKASEDAAKAYSDNADRQAASAGDSAVAALASETAAKASETNAAASASAAKTSETNSAVSANSSNSSSEHSASQADAALTAALRAEAAAAKVEGMASGLFKRIPFRSTAEFITWWTTNGTVSVSGQTYSPSDLQAGDSVVFYVKGVSDLVYRGDGITETDETVFWYGLPFTELETNTDKILGFTEDAQSARDAAKTSETLAGQYAATAQVKASEAANSAASASSAAASAQASKTAADSAKTEAETANNAAQSAKTDAETARDETVACMPKALYNLGAYDTVVANGDGTVTITRKTGYINFDNYLASPEWYYQSAATRWICYDSSIEINNDNLQSISNKRPIGYRLYAINKYLAVDTEDTNIQNVLTKLSGAILQYCASWSHAETNIEGISIDTLPQTGEQWLRSEWEKGLNLFSSEIEEGSFEPSDGSTYYTTARIRTKDFIKLSSGTYTISWSGVPNIVLYVYDLERVYQPSLSVVAWVENSNKYSFSLDSDLLVKFAFRKDNDEYVSKQDLTNVMLNKGDYAEPYHPYNGPIVHQKELEDEAIIRKIEDDYIKETYVDDIDDLRRISPYSDFMSENLIDATELDENKWYPVTIRLDEGADYGKISKLEVYSRIWLSGRPSWGLSTGGFSVAVLWKVSANGWGTQSDGRRVYRSTFDHCNINPVRGIGQITQISQEYVYVRGGGKYYFRHSTMTEPEIHPTGYHWEDGGNVVDLLILDSPPTEIKTDLNELGVRCDDLQAKYDELIANLPPHISNVVFNTTFNDWKNSTTSSASAGATITYLKLASSSSTDNISVLPQKAIDNVANATVTRISGDAGIDFVYSGIFGSAVHFDGVNVSGGTIRCPLSTMLTARSATYRITITDTNGSTFEHEFTIDFRS